MSEQDRERVDLDADEQMIERAADVGKDAGGDDADDFEGHRMEEFKIEEKVQERAQDV